MSENGADPRVVRTRRMLREALEELVKEKSFRSITVHEIAERATLNRSTFYAHYQDKFELLADCVVAGVQAGPHTPLELTPLPRLADQFNEMEANSMVWFAYLSQNPALGLTALKELAASPYLASIQQAFVDTALAQHRRLQPDDSACLVPRETVARFTVAGWVSLCVRWLEDGQPGSPEVLVRHITRLTLQGVWAALGLEVPQSFDVT